MKGNKITNIGTPRNKKGVIDKNYVDAQVNSFLTLDSAKAMTDDLKINSKSITYLKEPQ